MFYYGHYRTPPRARVEPRIVSNGTDAVLAWKLTCALIDLISKFTIVSGVRVLLLVMQNSQRVRAPPRLGSRVLSATESRNVGLEAKVKP